MRLACQAGSSVASTVAARAIALIVVRTVQEGLHSRQRQVCLAAQKVLLCQHALQRTHGLEHPAVFGNSERLL